MREFHSFILYDPIQDKKNIIMTKLSIALDYAGVLSEEKTVLLLQAIEDKQISSVGMYAYNKDRKRVAEIELKIDWKKHQQIISTFGDIFDDGQSKFDYKKGEATELQLVVDFLERATNEGLNISMWVRLVETITGKEREELLNRIGFNGGPPDPWIGEMVDKSVNVEIQESLLKKEGNEDV